MKSEQHDKAWKRRWQDDCRILQIIPAPPGWWTLHKKPPDEVETKNSNRPTIYDFCWVEPIAFFALLEEVQRLELLYGKDEWRPTSMTADEEAGFWPHTRVVPVAWHSGEECFPGADQLKGFRRDWDFIVRPPTTLDSLWLIEKFRPKDSETIAK